MKLEKLLILALVMTALLAAMTGCEYDGPTAMFYQEQPQTTGPEITQVLPANEAGGGVNFITIEGKNFPTEQEKAKVYFSGSAVDIVSYSATSIKVRRPNQVGDSTIIKVVNVEAMDPAVFGPYKITSVFNRFGNFIENLVLSAVAVDKDENIYIIQRLPRTIYKITPTGEKTTLGEAERIVTDAKIGPGGKLLLMMNNKSIKQVDLTTGEQTEWVEASERIAYGDFDSEGNFYGGSKRTGIAIIHADFTQTVVDEFGRDEIFCVRVYDMYVYLLVETARPDEETPEWAIWRFKILDPAGTLGEKELFFNWAAAEEYVMDGAILKFEFSSDGTLYIGNDSPHPILTRSPEGKLDILYKEILPSAAYDLVWGTGNIMYMLLGGEEWNIVRIDMGTTGAPYFGRD